VKRLLLIFALAAIVALPFAFQPKQTPLAAADDTIVIVTPHNEAIRFEFGRGFATWYRARTGRSVSIDWRNIGGTSEISRFLESGYTTAFERYWRHTLGRPWSADVQAGFQNPRPGADATAEAKAAREAFLASDVGCGLDIFFGGGTYDFEKQAAMGRFIDSGMMRAHPEWFSDDVMPQNFGGEKYWDQDGRWFGTVISAYGILFNRDSLRRLGFVHAPSAWTDLADPRLAGEVALADPTKSGSVAKAFENIIQQQMQRRLKLAPADEARAVREGWLDGLRLIQRIGANARYFTDTSQKPPIDVATGDCAAGLCIDFYGRQQQEAVRRRNGGTGVSPANLEAHGQKAWGTAERLGYVSPSGGSVASVDPIALLRGAKNRAAAIAFIEFSLSIEGQKLWNFRPGTEGGPERFALRRMPVRKDFYAHDEWKPLRSDPEESPFAQREPLVYRAAWTGPLFREMAFVIRVMCEDTHPELARAWRAISAAPEPAHTRALAALEDLSAVEYDRIKSVIRTRLGAKDKVEEVRLARELGDAFRANYARAEAIAGGRAAYP